MSGLYKLFGVSDGVARMSSALAGLLTLLLVFDLVRRVADPFAALMATLATGCLSGFYYEYHRVIVDPWLSLFVMLGYWAYVLAMFRAAHGGIDSIRNPQSAIRNPSPCPWAILILYLAGGLSFLAKGPVGPGLIAGPIIVSILWNRQWNFFRSWMHAPGALIFLALCALWPWLLYRSGGRDLLNGFLVDSLFARFFPPATGHARTGHQRSLLVLLRQLPGLHHAVAARRAGDLPLVLAQAPAAGVEPPRAGLPGVGLPGRAAHAERGRDETRALPAAARRAVRRGGGRLARLGRQERAAARD